MLQEWESGHLCKANKEKPFKDLETLESSLLFKKNILKSDIFLSDLIKILEKYFYLKERNSLVTKTSNFVVKAYRWCVVKYSELNKVSASELEKQLDKPINQNENFLYQNGHISCSIILLTVKQNFHILLLTVFKHSVLLTPKCIFIF